MIAHILGLRQPLTCAEERLHVSSTAGRAAPQELLHPKQPYRCCRGAALGMCSRRCSLMKRAGACFAAEVHTAAVLLTVVCGSIAFAGISCVPGVSYRMPRHCQNAAPY